MSMSEQRRCDTAPSSFPELQNSAGGHPNISWASLSSHPKRGAKDGLGGLKQPSSHARSLD